MIRFKLEMKPTFSAMKYDISKYFITKNVGVIADLTQIILQMKTG